MALILDGTTGVNLTTGYQFTSGANGTFTLQTGTSPTTALFVDANQNIGVGTTGLALSYKLQVNNPSASATADSIVAQNSGVTTTGHATGIRFRYITAEPAAIRAILTNTSSGIGDLAFFMSTDGTGANLTERMRIDTAGRVTKPYQPAFLVGFTGFSTTTTPAIIPTGGTIVYNNGSYYNATTRQFTAPVAGYYLFTASFLKTSSAVIFRGNFFKNGAVYGTQMRTTEGFTGYNDTATLTQIIQLAVNDTVDFRISSDTASTVYADGGTLNGNYNGFGGYLLG